MDYFFPNQSSECNIIEEEYILPITMLKYTLYQNNCTRKKKHVMINHRYYKGTFCPKIFTISSTDSLMTNKENWIIHTFSSLKTVLSLSFFTVRSI